MRALRPAVFFDRDGTLHQELPAPVRDPRELHLLDGVPHALASLTRAGFVLVVITNQSAVARGDVDHERLARVHAHLRATLAAAGARIERFYVCPHHPSEGLPPYRRACPCRKPAAGLFRDAVVELGLDVARSWVVGDALRDLEAGASIGARPILVATGKGQTERARLAEPLATRVTCVRDCAAAAAWILAQGR